MEIRKLFRFENSHIVRNCSSTRCKFSIHGHSYIVELFLEANTLDNGQMIYDFGLLKGSIKDLIDSFDHSIVYWDKDSEEYIKFIQEHSARWIALPVSPSAEQLSRVIFIIADLVLSKTIMQNGEGNVVLKAVCVHETVTGYAKAYREDITNPRMGMIDPKKIIFSQDICNSWHDSELWEKLFKEDFSIKNPTVTQQVV